jgi:hypothetical protein
MEELRSALARRLLSTTAFTEFEKFYLKAE